ncbi:hypothetical protein QUA62_27865 [Microcoleus sp. MON1_C1]|uniref:hypothetical protein n=1 Tax=unclassified Microcoleus TaxID=2642155 RepID=UPI002FD4C0E7
MSKIELSTARLEASLNAKIERHFDTLDTKPDRLIPAFVIYKLRVKPNPTASIPVTKTLPVW